jgi:hypothetical protein
MKTQYYQQGDVLLFKVDKKELPKDAKTWDGKKVKGVKNVRTPILQHGEATGHAHRITSPGFQHLEGRFGERFLMLTKQGTLSHEEHKTIILPPGLYKIRIVEEYDHFREVIRKVRD